MTKRLTALTDAAKAEADMDVSTPKTFTQHRFRRDAVQVSAAEVSAAEEKFTFKCGYCDRKFKDMRAKKIHDANCKHYYGTTESITKSKT